MRSPLLVFLGWLLFFALVTGGVFGLVALFRDRWTRPSKLRSALINVSVSVFTLLYFFLFLEIGFYFAAVQSDSFGYTLAAKRWFEKHWHPINASGYRDLERPEAGFRGKDLVMVVGDSFVAGHGVADYDDRFSNVLQHELGENWVVVNVAKSGWHTMDEYEAIVSYPHRPDVLVLSYYVNDIDHAARQHGLYPPQPFQDPPVLLRPLVRYSYFFNFVYWRLYRFQKASELDRISWAYWQEIYTNEAIWNTHAEELAGIIDYAKRQNIQLVTVVFPSLRDLERSRHITSKVVALMRQNGVPTIDVGKRVAGRDPSGLIVNSFDNHPGVALNREVAHWLLEEINEIRKPVASAPRP